MAEPKAWAASTGTAAPETGFRPRGLAKAGCVFALLLFPRPAVAQAAQTTPVQPPSENKTPAAPTNISYTGGQLKIVAHDATLADVLTKVAAVTGVKIEVPEGANTERMWVVELGPGPARQVLADLLRDTSFDYAIQATDADPHKIRSVMLIPREKGGGSNGTELAARRSRSPYARAVAPPVESASAPEPTVAAPPENVVAEATPAPATPPPEPTQPDLPARAPVQPLNSPVAAPLSPPAALNRQSISEQLQQMYQQRIQMTQQGRQSVPQSARSGARQ